MRLIKEFKEFAVKGNMVDLAIGVVIGAAFGKVVSSLVSDIIMPPVGLILGGIDFNKLTIKLPNPISTLPPVEVKYGLFINALLSFFLIALAIFLVIKVMNRWRSPPAATTKNCPLCQMSIPIDAKKCGHCTSNL